MPDSTDPQTREEWQWAVDAAHGALVLDSARRYGLVQGGPKVNVDRCQEILERGKKIDVWPSLDAVERYLQAMMREQETACLQQKKAASE